MASLIGLYNLSILKPNNQVYGCICRVKNACPLKHKCKTPGIIYQTGITNNKDGIVKIHYGLCETAFKERYHNHTNSFRHQKIEMEQNFLITSGH